MASGFLSSALLPGAVFTLENHLLPQNHNIDNHHKTDDDAYNDDYEEDDDDYKYNDDDDDDVSNHLMFESNRRLVTGMSSLKIAHLTSQFLVFLIKLWC